MCKSIKRYSKWIIILLLLLTLLVGGGLFYQFIARPHEVTVTKNIQIDGIYLPKSTEIKDFSLIDNHGQSFTKQNLKGRWTMMFFGFTHCGYVCPLTLAELNRMYTKLQKQLPKDKMPQIVFVTVDPERDTIAKVNQYVTSYNKNFIGVRAESDETQKLESQLNITAVKIESKDQPKGEYMVNHSTEILLFNPAGELQAYFAYPHKAEQMIKDYNLVLANS